MANRKDIIMEFFTTAMQKMENVVFVAGILILTFGLIQLFTALASQNADTKNHSGFIIAAGLGVMIVAKTLIPLVSSSISF